MKQDEEVTVEIFETKLESSLLIKLLNDSGDVIMVFTQDKKMFNIESIKWMAEKFGMKLKDVF